jgi:DNA-binding IclR family transcriptional regulator
MTVTMDPSAADGRAGDGGLKSVATTLDLLDLFMTDDELGVTEVARQLGVAKSSAHRMLTTLVSRGFAEKDPETGRYRLGLHVHELGQVSISRNRLRRRALPLMEELRQLTGQTIHLAIADGADVLHLERLQTRQGIELLADLPHRFPAHCSASGKALAAFDPDVASARRRARFPSLTAATLHTETEFDAMLVEVRRRGVAYNNGEARVGAGSIAAPVCDGSGRARAAISVVGATPVLDRSREHFTRLVVAATHRLSRVVSWA